MQVRAQKKSREQQSQETREALLRAAVRVVARHGYANASVSRITQAGGVAQGTLYSYFDSHQQLLDELLPAEGMRLLDELGRNAGPAASYFDHEERAFRAFFAYLARRPYFLRILTEAEIAAPASFAQHMGNIEERYLGALRRAQAAGEIRPQAERAFRVIAEVLSGSRGHIAIGFCDRSGERIFRPGPLPDWVAGTYAKFVRHGIGASGPLPPPDPAPRRRDRPAGRPDTRTLLLESAAQTILERGYAGATVVAITRGAGVAVGTFYAHFASRQEMFEHVLTHVRSRMLAHVTEAVRGARSFAEVEARGFHGFFEHLVRHPHFIRTEIEAAVWAPATYLRHFFDIADRYMAALRRSREAGELRLYEDHELPVLAYIFMAARHYLAARYVLAGPTPRALPAFVTSAYLDLVAGGLAAGPSC